MAKYNGKNVKVAPWMGQSGKVKITFDDGKEDVVALGAVGELTQDEITSLHGGEVVKAAPSRPQSVEISQSRPVSQDQPNTSTD